MKMQIDLLDRARSRPLASSSMLTLESWLSPHGEGALSSNVGAADLAFQRWFRFKEAYSPRLVMDVIAEMTGPVQRCIDPTGGSGTTGLVCSFLGIACETIEVNPFMADLIFAKTASYDTRALAADISMVLSARGDGVSPARYSNVPSTLIEPGEAGRWVYGKTVASQIGAFADAIDAADEAHRPFLRVMLGSVLKDVSNVIVSGKGRKYRRGWEQRIVRSSDVVDQMRAACFAGFGDIVRFAGRLRGQVDVHRGDARRLIPGLGEADCAIFSPPYPNSFDYTDIYNLELWMLGYLRSGEDNRALRMSTMHSHVQLNRPSRSADNRSPALTAALAAIDGVRGDLWHRDIPDMLRSYFADLEQMVVDLRLKVRTGGRISIVIGGSSYAGVAIDAPLIIAELGAALGLDLLAHRPLRSMRLSAQQGGQYGLSEDLVVFGC